LAAWVRRPLERAASFPSTIRALIPIRIALANLRFPASPEASVALAGQAIADASAYGAAVVCFPECYVPGYRAPGRKVAPPAPAFLESAFESIASAAARAAITVILGTERALGGPPVAPGVPDESRIALALRYANRVIAVGGLPDTAAAAIRERIQRGI